MNLIIDVGNSFVKFAVFNGERLMFHIRFPLSEFMSQYKLLKKDFPKLKKAIVSSVGKLSKEHIEAVKIDLDTLILNSKTKLPINNLYKTPDTLGVDRIALVCSASKQFPDQNVLIIDAGTCITYDFISHENNYLGGAISPGLRLRYKALNDFTANLPLLEAETPMTCIGNTTELSIHSGVVLGVINEIDGFIYQYKKKYTDLTVILTGGDAKFLSNQLKNSIFANSNFLLEGLNFILDFNSK